MRAASALVPTPGLPAMRALTLFLITIPLANAAIRFVDFASPDEIKTVGDAKVSGHVLRLTPAHRSRSGAAWFREKQSIGSGFQTTFQFQLAENGGLGNGADGFAFVL